MKGRFGSREALKEHRELAILRTAAKRRRRGKSGKKRARQLAERFRKADRT